MQLWDRLTGRAERQLQVQASIFETAVKERLLELELALTQYGWQHYQNQFDREFSREGLRGIMMISRLMFIKNPLINRAVSLQSIYVWGQGVTVSSKDEATNAAIQAFIKDDRNQVELFCAQARTMKEQDLQVLGNLFFVFFSSQASGDTTIRTLPVDEVFEIHCNPEDLKEAWYYRRRWTSNELNVVTGLSDQRTNEVFYPDFRYQPADRPPMIGGKPVLWDSPVFHVRVGGLSDMKWGIPETYCAQDWARAVTKFLEDWSTIVAAYARFAFKQDVKGGKAGIASAKAKLMTSLFGDGTNPETNPPSQTASTFLAGEGSNLTAVKTSGATTSPDDVRQLKQMICASFGMPETFFGDVSIGNHATAKTLDRPTELKFLDRQSLWKWIYQNIIGYVITKRSRSAAAIATELQLDQELIEVEFPDILQHDLTEQMGAIVSGATLAGSAQANTIDRETLSRLILGTLGVPNIDEVIAKMETVWEEADAAAELQQTAMTKAMGAAGGKPAVQESLRDLVRAIDGLRKQKPAA